MSEFCPGFTLLTQFVNRQTQRRNSLFTSLVKRVELQTLMMEFLVPPQETKKMHAFAKEKNYTN